MEVTMPGGTLMTVAHGEHGIDNVRERLSFHVDPAKWEFWGRNLCVRGNWACHFSDYTEQIAMIRNGFPVNRLITATYPIEEAAEAYRRFAEGERGKTILTQ
jgi:threonine dehydrogenase-like Zn-dependent dehydrogenase